MHSFLIMQSKKRLPRVRASGAAIGFALVQSGHAFAANNTLGAMAIGATADLVDLSSYGTWLLWLLGIGFAVGAVYHAVMHRNGRSTVPLVGVGLMLLCSGMCLGMPFIMAAASQSITGAAPAITQATAVQPFQVQ